ncbi:hypothetical protein [Rhodococcus jostii]|uniref:hypothetical protein n=1 Tax=Rhodococcus jostii TaxID=132919 RepID=UPI00362F3066
MGITTCAPLVAAVAAGGICAGAGIGAAATDDTNATAVPTHTTTDFPSNFYWQVTNHTPQSIYGYWRLNGGSDERSSHVESTTDDRWQPGDHAGMQSGAGSPRNWEAEICYDNHWWKYRSPLSVHTDSFSLEVDSNNTLHAVYNDPDIILGSKIQRDPFTAQKDAC